MKKITKILSIAMSVLLVNMLVMPKFDIKAQANEEEEKELVPLVVKSDGTYIDDQKKDIEGLTVTENLNLNMNNYTYKASDGYDLIVIDPGSNTSQFTINIKGTNTINVVKDYSDYKWELFETEIGAIIPFICGLTQYGTEQVNSDASLKFVGDSTSSLNINLSQVTNAEDTAAIFAETLDFEKANLNIKTPAKNDGINIGIVSGEGTEWKTQHGFNPFVINDSNIVVATGEGAGIVAGIMSKGTMDVTDSNVYATTGKCSGLSFLELTYYYSINLGVTARKNLTVKDGAYVYGKSGDSKVSVTDDEITSNISAGVSSIQTISIAKGGVVEGNSGNASTTFPYAISGGIAAIDGEFAGLFGGLFGNNVDADPAVVINGAAISNSGQAKNVVNAQAIVDNGTETPKIEEPTGDSVKNKIVDKDGNIVYVQSDTPAASQLAQSFDLTNEPTEVKDNQSVKLSDLAGKAIVKDTNGKTIKDAKVVALLADDGGIATIGSDLDTITFSGAGEIKVIYSNVSHRVSPNDPLLQTATIKVTSSATPQPQPVNPDDSSTSVSSSATGDNTINFAFALAALAALSCAVVVFSRKRFN